MTKNVVSLSSNKLGFPSLGVAAVVTSICAVALFAKVHAPARPAPAPEAAAERQCGEADKRARRNTNVL